MRAAGVVGKESTKKRKKWDGTQFICSAKTQVPLCTPRPMQGVVVSQYRLAHMVFYFVMIYTLA
jgi:hypothetical protein